MAGRIFPQSSASCAATNRSAPDSELLSDLRGAVATVDEDNSAAAIVLTGAVCLRPLVQPSGPRDRRHRAMLLRGAVGGVDQGIGLEVVLAARLGRHAALQAVEEVA